MTRPKSGSELYPGLYNSRRWRKLRKQFITDNPVCKMCSDEGFPRPGGELDHIEPHHGNPELFWDLNNLQNLCRYHHRTVKAKMERGDPRRGCKEDGTPNDPDHPWNDDRV